MEDNFLTQLVSEPTRGGATLDLLFTNREGLVGYVVVGGCIGLGGHEIIAFLVRCEVKRRASTTTTMDFRKADFGLFGMLVERVPWERVLKGKGVLVYEAGWNPPQSAEGTDGGAGQATLHHLSAVLANKGGPR